MSIKENAIVIIGAGSWGTALAISLARNGKAVCLWTRKEEAARQMRETRKNTAYLKEATLPASIRITSDLEEALRGRSFVVLATPSQSIRTVIQSCVPYLEPDAEIVSTAKGIEVDTLLLTTEVILDVLKDADSRKVGVLYGPSHAEEVALGMPTTVVASAHTLEAARLIQEVFMSPQLRVYMNPDMRGVQIAGSVKNVLAIAAGISDGIGFGDNAKAAIVTRGLAEMRRLGVAMGGRPETFSGLAGIGDLVVTCMSGLSRNRYLGEQIGKGHTLSEIESEMNMVAEGVKTTRSVHALGEKYSVELPITEAVHAILFEGSKPLEAVSELMGRSARFEDGLMDEVIE